MQGSGVHPTSTQQVDAALQQLALLDCHHCPIIEITGKDRADLLHRLSTNDLLSAGVGQTVHSAFLSEKGRLVDYVSLILKDDSILALVSPGNEKAFIGWIEKFTIMEDVKVRSRSEELACYSVIGPLAPATLHRVFTSIPEPGRFLDPGPEGSPTIISRRSEFGHEQFDIIANNEEINNILKLLEEQADALPLIEDESWQTFRILLGIPAFGHEISSSFNPLEVGLDHAISRRKGCYVGQEIIARLETYKKVQKHLAGVLFPASASSISVPAPLYERDGIEAGTLTSIAENPFGEYLPGLAVVRNSMVKDQDALRAATVNGGAFGIVTPLPMTPDIFRRAHDLFLGSPSLQGP